MKVKHLFISSSDSRTASAIRHLLSALLAVALMLLMLSRVMFVLNDEAYYTKMEDFYRYPTEYDVWFMGSSHVIMGTVPEELWNSYGIRSYNLAEYGQSFPLDYWFIKNLSRLGTPKLIVLDVLQIDKDYLYSGSNLGSLRSSMMALPWSRDKIDMINTLFEGDLKEEMIFPFATRHNNWRQVKEEYFVTVPYYELGGDLNHFRGNPTKDMVCPASIPASLPLDDYKTDENNGFLYFREIIRFCKENDIEVLVVKSPCQAAEKDLRWYNGAFRVAQEENVPYIDGFSIPGLVNGETDMWDETHLNASGARKWTDYLGNYISAHYPELCAPEMDEKQKTRWNERYNDYLLFYDEKTATQLSLYNYLMQASHPKYTVAVQIKEGSSLYQDGTVMALLNNIGDFRGLADAAAQGTAYSGVAGSESGVALLPFEADGEILITLYDESMEKIDQACFDASRARVQDA